MQGVNEAIVLALVAEEESLGVFTLLELLCIDFDESWLEVKLRVVHLDFVESRAWYLHAESALRVNKARVHALLHSYCGE